MKVGSLVYATDQGLGILAKSFYDHGIVTDPVVIRHGTHLTHDDWYPGRPVVGNLYSSDCVELMKTLCASVDVMLFFETPFLWDLVRYCGLIGTKTAIMTMYECTPEPVPVEPDFYLCPSLLDLQQFPSTHRSQSVYLPVPVCSDPSCPCTHKVQWRQREQAEVFVHSAGHGSFHDRNGTKLLLEAWDLVKSPAKLILRTQRSMGYGLDNQTRGQALSTPTGPITGVRTLEVRTGNAPYSDLYSEGDVFLFPERFNGLSLPLQEAYASGMLVMGMDRFPSNTWLPKEPLIPVSHYAVTQIGRAYRPFECAETYPKTVAEQIDTWYGQDISAFSQRGRQWAEANSWGKIGPIR
jgi:hypothetical protein